MTAGIDRDATVLAVSGDRPGTGPDREAGLITALRSLRELGRFTDAAELVHAADANPAGRLSPRAHAVAGPALAAVSDHAAAGVHLLLAAADPALAPAALGGLAELAWIEHDHPRGRAFALAGLALDPSHRVCRIQLQRNESGTLPQHPDRAGGAAGGRLAHAAFFADRQGNAGDRVLTEDVRRCFGAGSPDASSPDAGSPDAGFSDPSSPDAGSPGGVDWRGVHVHQLFDERRLAEVNAGDGLIVGGGGLFLPDTAPNGNSGWQWNIADDVLARIDVPLVVFAVGYNVFEGQTFEHQRVDGSGPDQPGGRFARSLRLLVEHAAFVGLRNHGSVDRVRELLPAALAERVVWQPCPTTITDLLPAGPSPDPALDPPSGMDPDPDPDPDHDRADQADQADQADLPAGAVLLNCAYDRAGRRFGAHYGAFLAALRDWVVSTRERADVRYVSHCVDDERFVADLRREYGLTLPVIAMYDLTPAQIRRHYRRAALVVGMRGHAGMIPFGCGTPIISLVSHPKLGYFLDDIGRPEWGLPVRDPQLAGRLRELTTDLLDHGPAVRAQILVIRQRLAGVTHRNLASLPASLLPSQRLRQDDQRE